MDQGFDMNFRGPGCCQLRQDPRKSGYMVDTDPDRKFQNEGARLDTNRTGF